MTDKLKSLGMDTAFLVDRGLAILILFGVYTFATNLGKSWIDTQNGLIIELKSEREETGVRWKELVSIAKADDELDNEIIEKLVKAIELNK